jgi:bacteriocin-like protein
MDIQSQMTHTSTNTLTNKQLTQVQGGILEAPQQAIYDEQAIYSQPWRNDQHVNSITSRKHTGYASKFNAMN